MENQTYMFINFIFLTIAFTRKFQLSNTFITVVSFVNNLQKLLIGPTVSLVKLRTNT